MLEFWNLPILPLKVELLTASDEAEVVHGNGPSEDATLQVCK